MAAVDGSMREAVGSELIPGSTEASLLCIELAGISSNETFESESASPERKEQHVIR